MCVKKILSLAASTIRLFIIIIIFSLNSKADEDNIKYYSDDKGILALMYHRFDEKKYPSTNIQMNIFRDQIRIIKDLNYNFYNPIELEKNFKIPKNEKKIYWILLPILLGLGFFSKQVPTAYVIISTILILIFFSIVQKKYYWVKYSFTSSILFICFLILESSDLNVFFL